MRKIEHLGIAVKDLESSKKMYEVLLKSKAYKEKKVESEGVSTLFLKLEKVK